MNNIVINKYFKKHTKTYCVFGCLLSDEGIKIKDEMLSWLIPNYDVISVEQELPGKLYEYPAIKYLVDLSKNTNELVLYVHTKGAANKGIIQEKIRKMWNYEFVDKKEYYINKFNNHINDAIILCPFTGEDKNTWFNGFYMTPTAAKKTQNLSSNNKRHYWEAMYKDNDKIKIIGRVFNNISNIKNDENIYYLLKYIKENY